MVSQQRTILEFLAKPRQARPHSNVSSVILINDSSEESADEQEPDAVASQEEATCSASISADTVDCTSSDRSDDRREESEDSEGSSADLQLSVAQVSYNSDLVWLLEVYCESSVYDLCSIHYWQHIIIGV